jgi:GNAT superfamily N-acetyltransferase
VLETVEPSAPRYRVADEGDNAALLALAEQCPMDGSLSLYIDRSPEYARFFRHLDPGYDLIVAEQRERIIGSIAGVRAELIAGGSSCSALCVRDLKVAQEFRRRTVAHRLVRHVIEAAGDRIHGGLVLFAAGNALARTLAEGRAALPRGTRLADVRVCNVFTGFSPKRVSVKGLRALRPDDAESIAAILQSRAAGLGLAPAWSAARLRALTHRLPGFDWSNGLGVEERGRLVAILCDWDPGGVAAYRVVSYRGWLGAIERTTRFLGWPVLSAPGQPLRFRFVVGAACLPGHEAALAGCFAELAARCRRGRFTHFTLTLAESDDRTALLPKAPRISLRYVPYFIRNPRAADPVDIAAGAPLDVPLEVFL